MLIAAAFSTWSRLVWCVVYISIFICFEMCNCLTFISCKVWHCWSIFPTFVFAVGWMWGKTTVRKIEKFIYKFIEYMGKSVCRQNSGVLWVLNNNFVYLNNFHTIFKKFSSLCHHDPYIIHTYYSIFLSTTQTQWITVP